MISLSFINYFENVDLQNTTAHPKTYETKPKEIDMIQGLELNMKLDSLHDCKNQRIECKIVDFRYQVKLKKENSILTNVNKLTGAKIQKPLSQIHSRV